MNLGQFNGLRLVGGLGFRQTLLQSCNACIRSIQLVFKVVHGHGGICQFALGLCALLASTANNFMHPAISGFHRPVVEFHGQRCQTVAQ